VYGDVVKDVVVVKQRKKNYSKQTGIGWLRCQSLYCFQLSASLLIDEAMNMSGIISYIRAVIQMLIR
jgi:hypothetical protein